VTSSESSPRTAGSSRWDRASLVIVVSFCAVKALVHLALVNRYGYHGDELYFLECGRHLAFGYVDHPPLIPWIARLADELGGSLITLRVSAIAAGVGTMAFSALLVREWGGGWRAQLLTLLCLLFAPAHLRMAAMLDIPVIEVFLCTVTAYLVARALARGEQWLWLLAGATLGIAILAKHSSLIWAGALVLGILASPSRSVLASRWPWLGVAVALLLFAPNLAWEANHEFVMFEFMSTARREVLATQGRGLFAAGQLLYFHPFAVPVWVAGLVFAFTNQGRVMLPFALIFIIMFAFFLIMGGKPYYLASAYPAVLAAGGIALERWLVGRIMAWRTLAASLAITGVALALLTLPVLPLPTVDAAIGFVLGWAVPPMALTHDLHGMFGWQEHAATVDSVYESLPVNERNQASILAGSFAQAAALNLFRRPALPRAVSGNMTYYLWGPDGERGQVLIAYGVPRELLERHYRMCAESVRINAPLARPWDTNLPVYVCREPFGTMTELWPDLRRFGTTPLVVTAVGSERLSIRRR
jgi:4-amino-4-deoxy-L-arabinose transferase-like glycosyltransferase